jgi:predicted RecB family nuclease
MTYEKLKAHIENMTEEQLKSDVTICVFDNDCNSEFFKADVLGFTTEADILDAFHPYITIYTGESK